VEQVHRRSAAAGARLRSARDALDVITFVLDGDTTAVALVDRPPPLDGLVACCDGPFTLADLDRFDECILDAAAASAVLTGAGCRMVLASRGAAGIEMVDEAEIELWRKLQARHGATTVPLLDWFVVSGETAFSLAELAGPRARWRPPR
jgi:hypothetical protein